MTMDEQLRKLEDTCKAVIELMNSRQVNGLVWHQQIRDRCFQLREVLTSLGVIEDGRRVMNQ